MVTDITHRRPEAARRVMQIVLLQEAASFGVCLYLLLHGCCGQALKSILSRRTPMRSA